MAMRNPGASVSTSGGPYQLGPLRGRVVGAAHARADHHSIRSARRSSRSGSRPTRSRALDRCASALQRAGLNFADVSARVGLYPDAPKPPMVMGYEVSGTVAALGEGVSRAAGRHAGAWR